MWTRLRPARRAWDVVSNTGPPLELCVTFPLLVAWCCAAVSSQVHGARAFHIQLASRSAGWLQLAPRGWFSWAPDDSASMAAITQPTERQHGHPGALPGMPGEREILPRKPGASCFFPRSSSSFANRPGLGQFRAALPAFMFSRLS